MIRFIRLVTGEDIITEIKEKGINGITTLMTPLKILYYADPETEGKITMGFFHWVFPGLTVSQEFNVENNQIIVNLPATEVISNRYHEHLKLYNKTMESLMEPKDYMDDLPTDGEKLKVIQDMVSNKLSSILSSNTKSTFH